MDCDGQVLVLHDMVGMFKRFTPKFVKVYADVYSVQLEAVKSFIADVQNKKFPARRAHLYHEGRGPCRAQEGHEAVEGDGKVIEALNLSKRYGSRSRSLTSASRFPTVK